MSNTGCIEIPGFTFRNAEEARRHYARNARDMLWPLSKVTLGEIHWATIQTMGASATEDEIRDVVADVAAFMIGAGRYQPKGAQ